MAPLWLAMAPPHLWFELGPLCLLVIQCVVGLIAPDVCWPPRPGQLGRLPGGTLSALQERHRHPALQQLIGRWRIEERHNMNEFLEGLGFNGFMRAMLVRASQDQVITHGGARGEMLRILTTDLRGTSELELPLAGRGKEGLPVLAHDGDDGADVFRSVKVDDSAVEVAERFPGDTQPLSVCRRTLLPDGRMCIDIRKRASGKAGWLEMRTIFSRY